MKKIHLLGLNQKWSPGWDFYYLKKILDKIQIQTSTSKFAINSKVYLPNKYYLNKSFYHIFNNKVYFDYFHGHPTISPELKNIFDYTLKNQNKFYKVRVTNNIIYDLFVENGLKHKLSKIYLGVDNQIFKEIDNKKKKDLKNKMGLSLDYTLIGSFQKDGEGWGLGNTPKMIKGPDIFIETVKKIKKKNPKIVVILLGPSRGYIKTELKKNNILYFHNYENNYFNLYEYYNILDFYLITSREEGGPKALLESMACGIPVVSTPVGQSLELIKNYDNGLIINDFSPDNLADKCIELIENKQLKIKITTEGKKIASKNDHMSQLKLWKEFFS